MQRVKIPIVTILGEASQPMKVVQGGETGKRLDQAAGQQVNPATQGLRQVLH